MNNMVNYFGFLFILFGLIIFLLKNYIAKKWRAPRGYISNSVNPPLYLKWGLKKSIYITKITSLILIIIGILIIFDIYINYPVISGIVIVFLFLWILISMIRIPNEK